MPLEYRLNDIPNYKTVCLTPTGMLRPTTEVIVHAMMMLGLEGRITSKNVDEACDQFNVLQLVAGPLLRDPQGNGVLVTSADVRAHVGLWTNCFSPAMNTRAGFKKFIWAHLADRDHVAKRLAGLYKVEAPRSQGEVV